MWKHLFVITWRRLLRHKWETLLAVCCLTVGMLCMGLAGYYYMTHKRGDSVFPTYDRMAEFRVPDKTYSTSQDARKGLEILGAKDFDAVAKYVPGWVDVFTTEKGDACYRLSVSLVNEDYFKVYPTEVLEGSLKGYGAHPHTLVLTDECVKRYFPGQSMVGKSLAIEGEWYVVLAVVRAYPAESLDGLRPEAMRPIPADYTWGYCRVLLREPSDTVSLNARLRKALPRGEGGDFRVVMVKDFSYPWGGDVVLFMVGILVLFCALFNYYSYSFSKFVLRQRELRLRMVLGSSGHRLFLFLFVEQAMVQAVSLLLTLALSESLVPMLFGLLPQSAQKGLLPDISLLLRQECVYGAVLMGVSFLFSWIAVACQRRILLRKGLSGRGETGTRRFRNAMLVFQLCLGISFMYGLFAVIGQVHEDARRANPGLTEEQMKQIIEVSISGSNTTKRRMTREDNEMLMARLKTMPWCEALARWGSNMYMEEHMCAWVGYVDDAFLRMMKLPVKHREGELYAYVNKQFKDAWVKDSTACTEITFLGKTYPVLGEVPDLSLFGFAGPEEIMLIPFNEENWQARILVQVKPGSSMSQVKEDLKELMSEYNADNCVYELRTLHDWISNMTYGIFYAMFLISVVICLLVSVLGIYNAVQADTEGRQKEVAVRKINGAAYWDIYWLFGRNYLGMYLLSAFVATVLFVLVCKTILINAFTAWSWSVFVWPLLIAWVVVVITVVWRIGWIARIKPAFLLRTE